MSKQCVLTRSFGSSSMTGRIPRALVMMAVSERERIGDGGAEEKKVKKSKSTRQEKFKREQSRSKCHSRIKLGEVR